tara:strand:+ start:371 stop:2032 length:1662 start_codon:yes stop_codon:yes gene_type:complete
MANEITLQESHPVDENLRPLKVGGKTTAIETAQWGDGAKINGDLLVTGDIKGNVADITFDDVILGDITAETITLADSALEIIAIDHDYSSTDASTVKSINIDLDKTGASTSNNTISGLTIDMDNTTATNGTNIMYGIRNTPTLTHAADAGTNFVTGLNQTVTGSTNGTSIAYGIRQSVTGADTQYGFSQTVDDGNLDIQLFSSASNGDYFTIATGADGATTFTTVDGGGEEADLIFNIDGYIDLNSASGEGITLDSGGDITLDADGDNITMLAGGTGSGLDFIQSGTGDYTIKNLTSDKDVIFNVNDGGSDTEVMRLKGGTSNLDMGSSRKITFGDTGEHIYGNGTNLFVYSSGILHLRPTGNLEIDSGAGIILDSATGAFVMKGAGTTSEFSVANSAYAGMIIGYRLIGEDVSHSSYTLTTGFVVPDADMTVRFIAPPSGNVEVMVQVLCNMSTANRVFYFGLSDNATYNTIGIEYEQISYQGDETDDNVVQHCWGITGLTAGDTYNYWLGAKISSGTGYLNWGGNASGRYADFIMKVTALPAATSDFAVYD